MLFNMDPLGFKFSQCPCDGEKFLWMKKSLCFCPFSYSRGTRKINLPFNFSNE